MPIAEWRTFFVAAMFVIGAGIAIGRLSGELGERFGLGRAWSGAVLLSFATSLPELVTTITVSLRGAYGLALGGILGSIIFNLLILVFVDIADPDPLYNRLSKNHLATGLLGAALLGILMTGLALGLAHERTLITTHPRLLLAVPVAILGLYGIGQFVLFRMAQQTFEKAMVVPTVFSKMPFWVLLSAYGLTAAIILVAANALGLSAERLTSHYGLAATFGGATLLGVVTSLPEITNAMACARQREYDLAVGNILGANSLVLVVLAVASLIVGNKILSSASFEDSVSTLVLAGLAVLMQAVALGALAVESTQHVRRVSIASLILAGLYGTSLFLSYQFGK